MSKTQPIPDSATGGITSYRLLNGFKIILAPYPTAPNVRVELTVKTGSLLEGYGETGMAHLLEHMLFKGAGKRPNIKNDLTRIGARWNADTTADRTSYFEVVSAEPSVIDEAIRIEADRFMHAHFTPADLASEMTVVRNELERNDTNPQSVVFRSVLRQSYFWHGYGRPTIGARSDIEDAPFRVLTDFHAKHYRPDNAFLIVSGNFDAKHVLALVSDQFSKAKNPAVAPISSWTREASQASTQRSDLFLPAGITMTMSAWRMPGSFDRQTVALSLASSAICSEAWGSLRKEIVLNRKVAVAASCFGFDKPQTGLFVVTARGSKDDDAEKINRQLTEFIEEAAKAGISSEQLVRAKEEEANAFIRVSNAHDQFSRMLSDGEVAGDWRLAFLQQDIASNITLDEANTALRTWLIPTNRSDVLLRHADHPVAPELPKPSDVKSQLAGRTWPSVVTKNDPLPQNASELTKATVKVPMPDSRITAALIARKTQGDLAWILIGNDYGNETTLRGRMHACNMASALISFGGNGLTRDQLDAKLEKLQANWEINLGRLSVNAPRKGIEEALDTLLGVWQKPALPRAEFERMKSSAIAGMESSLKDASTLAANQMELRFDNYPSDHPRKTLPLEQELQQMRSLSYEQAVACHTEFAGISHVRLSVVGDFSVTDVQRIATKLARIPPASVTYARIPEIKAPDHVDVTPIVFARPNTPNASIAGMAVLPITDDNEHFADLRIAINILGGNTSSRIWTRLRETEGLAYSAGASLAGSSFEPRTIFSISASASSDKAEIAQSNLKEVLATALKDGFTNEEIEAAKKTWQQDRRKYASDERLYAARLAQGMLNGRDFAWIAEYDTRIAAVTPQSATAALRKYLGSAPIVWMVGKGSD